MEPIPRYLSRGIRDNGVKYSASRQLASVASLLITTEAMIAERPKDKAAGGMPGGMGGGGMGGGMGGMDF